MQPPSPPKAPEFNAVVHAALDPVLRPLGFGTRPSGPPTWKRRESTGGTLFFRIQRRADATDPYAGGEFKIEIERATGDKPYVGLAGRATFDQLLSPADLDQVVEQQRRIIQSLPRPPARWVAGYPEALRKTYLSFFDPDEKFTPGNHWFRFSTLEDVGRWARLIAGSLPVVVDRAGRLSPNVMYMGSRIDLDANPLEPIDPIVLKPRPTPAVPPDPNWRPVSRRARSNLVCAVCGNPIESTGTTIEMVGYPGVYHLECSLLRKPGE